MPFSSHRSTTTRCLIEKWYSFVLILTAMLILLAQDNRAMEWTITKGVLQCLAMVLAVGLLSFFALHYLWLENILYRLQQILHPLHYTIGALARIKKSASENLRPSAQTLGERLKQNGKGLKRSRNDASLISLYSGQKRKTSPLSKKRRKKPTRTVNSRRRSPRKRIVRSKLDFFS